MNERIEHITKQVDEYFDDLTIEFSREAWQAKFAELVVRECADVGSKFSMAHPEDIRYQIKRHFGVEE
jgi:hypothetical protein